MIFDYSDIPETTSLPPLDFTDATVMPLWRVRDLGLDFDLRPSSVSKPFFCSCSIRFSIRGKDKVHGIIIDYPYNEGPTDPLGQVVTLMEKFTISLSSHECYRYNKSTILSRRVERYLFSWPDEQDNDSSPLSLYTESAFGACRFGPFLDEQSGRLIASADMASKSKHRHDIWDFALLYKSFPIA